MGLDATTFVLEIVNFLVLLWLLSRFLFRPVQAAITRRQREDEAAKQALEAQRLAVAAQQKDVAQARARLDVEREAAREKLSAEIAEERARRLDALNAELDEERVKAQARAAARSAEEARREDERAARRAQEFLRRFLARLAGPELERAIAALFVADLAALDAEARKRLAETFAGAAVAAATAFEATEALRQQVEKAVRALLGRTVAVHWQIDPALVAGISVRLDGHLLEASLARALDAFGPDAEDAS
jgi:F-type H+-transporting ATPase subunit b